MGRDAKCPRCDFKAPTVTFLNAADEGSLAVAVLKLPKSVQNHYLAYFSLFRPKTGCAVSIKKAERLTNELAELVNSGFVKQKSQVDRSCSPRIWGMAMEQMLERAATLTLPLKTHGYVRTIAWDLANKESAGQEQTNRAGEASCQSARRGMNPDVEKSRRIAAEKYEKEMEEWKKSNEEKLDNLVHKANLKGMD